MNRVLRKLQVALLQIGLLCFSYSAFALPCHFYSQKQLKSLSEDDRGAYLLTCFQPLTAGKGGAYSTQALPPVEDSMRWDEAEKYHDKDTSFWDDWQTESSGPMLKDNSSSAFYGLGLWLPKKYESLDIMTLQDAKEWVMKHGVMMSFGLGSDDGQSTKYRIDYMWHEDEQDGVMLQVDIPLK
ncbi:hypothetical protein [Photobacterium halotolerans]|uniref:hypothetical protein n=1 Tax=Photobacterium halotolerans TaxID=265726 RepID=UPI000B07EEB0|nr:hypothetical protein [Photobacterium halotolerans]